ncbi:MAG TPA: XRE family transcriptional regulator [Lachnospiraceae bacterium]|jgi:transcriptional regulator with XRE-family HTH domain/uncharacterized protein YxeA|nr:XRE family transcriptional regulator [Lachnospiraceae bacterium]
MILAEKIMKHRKQNGWSQEELAMKLNISRQSVSKWESTAAIPDLDKIIKLSEIFEVSTDYLLKDELEDEAGVGTISDEEPDYNNETVRTVSLQEANSYMELIDGVSKKMAAAVAACILSPVLLILLGGLSEYRKTGITEDMAGGIGVTILLLIVAGAVAVFILIGMQLDKFEYLEKESLNLQYGVAGIAETKRNDFEPVYKRCIASGVALCIVSAVPIMIAAAFNSTDMVYIYCVVILLVLIAFAVFLFVWSGMIYGSYQKLLEEGDYTRSKKLESKRNDNLSKVYWCTATAIYLGTSFLTGRWEITWVIWPCAGVLYAAVCGIAAMLRKS